MHHRLDAKVFLETSRDAAKFLMLCSLRQALRGTDQFREDAKGIIVCLVDKEWIWPAKSAAMLLMTGGRDRSYYDDFRRPVHIIGEAARRTPGKGVEDFTVFRPEHQVIYLATSLDGVKHSLQLAADVIVDLDPPTARHIIAARKLLGVDDVDLSLAEVIARQPAEIVIGLTLRKSLKGLDPTTLTKPTVAPVRSPKLSDLPGYGPARAWIDAIKQDVADWRDDKVPWSDVDRGVLLVGPPGTGKTLFASALANELGFDLVPTSVGAWQGSNKGYLGDMLAAMSASFADATSRRGAVLLVDELDAIGDRTAMRGDHAFYEGNVIGRFLDLTTHALEQPGTIIVGATNYGHLIDNAILRSGRLEKHVHLDLPEEEERAEILSYHLNRSISATDLRGVTDKLRLATPADLERLARAAKRSARIRQGVVGLQDVKAALPAKVPLPEAVIHRICVHEVGHALMTMASGVADVISVRVESHMTEGEPVQDGGRVHYKMRDVALPIDKDLLAKIRIMLGGTAAEEVVFGSRSIGAGGVEGSDLDQATRLAYRLVGSYGLGKWLRYQVGADRVDGAFLPAPELRAEVDGILAREYRATKDLLTKEKARLMRLAAELVVDRQLLIGKS
ncbi:AAA family ATPase [Rhizobium ruizarguesonis]|uniref:AAA family ATPase n=1 Tax=Rhizobium ruizarguesonis TaxID=2081791 RepID=UPI001031C2CB|nr:AAA family ATPase [Rhizobium ruizarguesonis]TBD80717.1 AAA family ATPase [Rhizobium ruizarguesonis]TBE11878.1 AAA family ATPase [Rhizobium ruizarguesonis]TBE23761.1 AAA family ATPase [Rhizobium ruizarguesonis]TBE33602.1 AAA family ATPase [Rhizobium ruizarguesonis]WSG99991.1 AAA family ATPase [Rhizobium ruizarguesonis]